MKRTESRPTLEIGWKPEHDPDREHLQQAIQKQDPRDILSRLRIPTAEQHQEWIANPLKRAKPPSEAVIQELPSKKD